MFHHLFWSGVRSVQHSHRREVARGRATRRSILNAIANAPDMDRPLTRAETNWMTTLVLSVLLGCPLVTVTSVLLWGMTSLLVAWPLCALFIGWLAYKNSRD